MFNTYEDTRYPGYKARILADSVNTVGDRITTFELTYPRFVHAELMTHRLFSRNSASSRAIPFKKFLERVGDNPAMPAWWGRNQSGMQAHKELDDGAKGEAKKIWLEARDKMIQKANELYELGVHKQIVNRLLEPWMFITVIVTATEFDNWFHLRHTWKEEGTSPGEAQPEIAWVAHAMHEIYTQNSPEKKYEGEWHLPLVDVKNETSPLYVDEHEESISGICFGLAAVSTARCARVSYLTHDGDRDLYKDIELHDRLISNGHWSPAEHAAQAMNSSKRSGNFVGWHQYRKLFRGEHNGRRIE